MRQERVVARRLAAADRQLQAEIGVLLHEFERVRASEALAYAVDILDLGEVRRVVGRHQWRPQLLYHPAAIVLENLLEPADLLVAEREILIERDDPLQMHFRRRVMAHGMHRLRRGRGGADEIGIGLALRHVVGAGETHHRRLVLRDIVGDRQELEGGQGTEDEVHMIALDQFLRLRLGAGGAAAGVGGNEIDLAPGKRVILVLQEGDDALFHLDAAFGQRPGLNRQKADPHRRALGNRGQRQCRGSRTREKGPSSQPDGHFHPPFDFSNFYCLGGTLSFFLLSVQGAKNAVPSGACVCASHSAAMINRPRRCGSRFRHASDRSPD